MNPKTAVLKSRIAKQVHWAWCSQQTKFGMVIFKVGTTARNADNQRVWKEVGRVSSEYLELVVSLPTQQQIEVIERIVQSIKRRIEEEQISIPKTNRD